MCFHQTGLIITNSSILFNSKLSIQSLPIHSAFQRFIIPSSPIETNTFIFQTSLNLHITFSFLSMSNYLFVSTTTLQVQKMHFYSNLCLLSLSTELSASSHWECSRRKNVSTIKISITKGFIIYSETFSCAICSSYTTGQSSPFGISNTPFLSNHMHNVIFILLHLIL